MYKQTAKAKWFTVFLLIFPLLVLSSIQSAVFSKAYDEPLGKIQGYAFRNTNGNEKYAKSNNIVLMGAFASSDEPTTQPIPLKFEYTTFDKFYVGVVIVNNSGKDKDVTVIFELSGQRSGKEEEYFTIPADYTYFAYIYDGLSRPGFYTYKISAKGAGSAKIKLLFTE